MAKKDEHQTNTGQDLDGVKTITTKTQVYITKKQKEESKSFSSKLALN